MALQEPQLSDERQESMLIVGLPSLNMRSIQAQQSASDLPMHGFSAVMRAEGPPGVEVGSETSPQRSAERAFVFGGVGVGGDLLNTAAWISFGDDSK